MNRVHSIIQHCAHQCLIVSKIFPSLHTHLSKCLPVVCFLHIPFIRKVPPVTVDIKEYGQCLILWIVHFFWQFVCTITSIYSSMVRELLQN